MSTTSSTAYLGPVFNSLYAYDGRKLASDYELLREYATNDIVYSCVNYNAGAVAQVPFRLYTTNKSGKAIKSHSSRRANAVTKARLRKNSNLVKMIGPGDDVVEITEHPLLDLLYQDNDGLNGMQFFGLTQTYMEIMGRSYWQLENASITGRPTGLYMLKSQRTMPVRNIDGDVISYKIQPDLRGSWLDLDLADVIDFRMPHPEDPYGWGMSPLKAAFMQAGLTSKFTQFGNDLMDNRARIDGIFTPADDTSPEMARKAEEQFAQRFSKGRNGGIWFSPTKGTFTPTRYSPTDLAPMEVDKNTTSRLCRAFGIPEPLMSANEATFSNMDKALTFHAKFTTTPRLMLLEQRLNDILAPLFDDRLFLAVDNPVPEDNEFELKKTQVAITAGALTKNEIRDIAGFEPMAGDGNDELPSDAEPEDPSEKEPPKKTEPVEEEKPVEKAIIDTDKLIALNKAVTVGDMSRTAAMGTIQRAYGLTREESNELVGYARISKADDELEGHWVTIDGAHVFIGKDGTIEKGPKPLVGKKPNEIDKAKRGGKVEEKKPLSDKAKKAKETSRHIGADIQRYSEEHNENKLAKAIGGVSLRDNEPVDVIVHEDGKIKHGVELKTMTNNKQNKVYMKAAAMEKKRKWMKKNHADFHTVVYDDQKVYNAKGEGKHGPASDRRMFYKRGVGSFRVGAMHEIASIKELQTLMNTPTGKLPDAAKPSTAYPKVRRR